MILEDNAQILHKYLSERKLIPEGHLAEVAFDELEADPMATMDRIYTQLGLKGFDAAAPSMQDYLDSVREYKRNTYRPLPQALLKRIQTSWDFWFKEFGYSKESE